MKNKTVYVVGLAVILIAVAAYYFNADVKSSVNSFFSEEGGFLSAPINPGEGTQLPEQPAEGAPTTPAAPATPTANPVVLAPKPQTLLPNAPLQEVKRMNDDRPRLMVGKIAPDAVFTISQSATVEPKQIPFTLATYLDTTEKDKYQSCMTILKDGVRASDTECVLLDKNFNLSTKIGITDLGLLPHANDGYMPLGRNRLEVVVILVKNDPLLVSKIVNDTAADLNFQIANAAYMEKTGQFVLEVTK